MPTASLMLRTELVRHMPSWFHEFAPVGDYYIQVLCSIPSGALFLPDIMAAYRVNIKGSWTSKYQNKESRKQWVLKDHKAMMAMNRYLDYLYERSLKYLFCKRVFTVLKSPSFPVAEKLDIYNEVSSFLMPLCRVYVGLTAVFSNIILIPARKLKSIIKSHCRIRIFL
jgi:hypothetical protein